MALLFRWLKQAYHEPGFWFMLFFGFLTFAVVAGTVTGNTRTFEETNEIMYGWFPRLSAEESVGRTIRALRVFAR